MGHVVSQVLLANDLQVVTCLAGRSERTQRLSRLAGVTELSDYDTVVSKAQLILSILPPASAEGCAELYAAAVRRVCVNADAPVYADCNAVSPTTTRRIGEIVAESGSLFVDGSIIGPPPREKGSTRFYASGPDLDLFLQLQQFGLDVRVVGPEIGQASGIKMTYAALTKGWAALSFELLMAARSMKLDAALKEEFELSQQDHYQSMQRLLQVMPSKSRRWVAEMREISKTFGDLGFSGQLHEGAAQIYELIGSTSLGDENPETVDHNRPLSTLIDQLVSELKRK